MNFLKISTLFSLPLLLLFVIFPSNILGQNISGNFIANSLPQLKQIGSEMNQQVLPLLALIQEYEKYGTFTESRSAKIIHSVANVRETNSPNSNILTEVRLNEEFPILDEQEKWYKIKTKDNREGWIMEEDIQIISKQLFEPRNDLDNKARQESQIILAQMARYKSEIDKLYLLAGTLINTLEEQYKGLTREIKQKVEAEYKLFQASRSKIEKYYGYSVRFYEPYEGMLAGPSSTGHSKVAAGERFKGTASFDIGRSNYRNMNSSSTTSRRIGFSGIYQVDRFTRVNLLLNHQNELIQTSFTNNMVEAGISRQIDNKLNLGGKISYNQYDDQATDNNTFGQLRAGMDVVFNAGKKASVFGNANYHSKNFKFADNDYQGVFYALGTSLVTSETSSIRLQVQGNTQFSDKDYLNFNQISPKFEYIVKRSPVKSFTAGFDYDLLKYAVTNNFNDYQKFRTDFWWRNTRNKKLLSKNLNLTYKQYPENGMQDYFRLGYNLSRRKGSMRDERSTVSSFSPVITFVTKPGNNSLTDYLDLRWDRTRINPKGFITTNIYSRMWNNLDMILDDTSTFPDHYVDFYSEFGPFLRNMGQGNFHLSSMKIGLIAGGHIYYNFDENYFMRNGNSLRAGIGLTGVFKIHKARLELAGSYEHSWILVKETLYDPITGDVTYGDDLLRDPSSFQFRVDFRLPVARNWDIHFNLNSYDIRTDATTETSINPVERKSNMRVFGGLIYRFAI